MLVEPGDAVTDAAVIELSPVAGLHAYAVAPETLNGTEAPLHIMVLEEMESVGVVITVMVTTAELVQVPTPPVTV